METELTAKLGTILTVITILGTLCPLIGSWFVIKYQLNKNEELSNKRFDKLDHNVEKLSESFSTFKESILDRINKTDRQVSELKGIMKK